MSTRRTLAKSESKSNNPAVRFLEWKSNDRCFAYFDKNLFDELILEGKTKDEIKEGKLANIKVELPLKFQFLEHFHVVKGFSDAEQTGIYSNEVMFTSKEPLTVKTFNGKTIAEGLYSNIRAKVRDAGGKYHKSIYVVDGNGDIINLQVKGSVVSAWSTFLDGDKKLGIEGNGGKIESHWIEINKAQDLKKGATKYSVPVFEIGDAFNEDELDQANVAYPKIAGYYTSYTEPKEETFDSETEEEDIF